MESSFEIIFENQMKEFIFGEFTTDSLSKFNIHPFTNEKGEESISPTLMEVPKDWEWINEWKIEEWEYAVSWEKCEFSFINKNNCYIRRRKWIRERKKKKRYEINLINSMYWLFKVYREEDTKRIIALQRSLRLIRLKKKLKEINKLVDHHPLLIHLRQRKFIILELISTENTYLLGLKRLNDVYLFPLQNFVKEGNPLISEKDIENIFGNILTIYHFHCLLYEELKMEWEKNKIWIDISSLLIKKFHFLKMYIPYINNFQNSLHTINKCRQSRKFRDWFKLKNKEVDLNSLLILSVQRIPRYVLLFQQLIKTYPEDHVHFKKMSDLVKLTTDIAEIINSAKKEAENGQRLYEIQKNCHKNEIINLLERDRKFEKECYMKVINEKDSKIEPFFSHVFLFNDGIMISVKNENDTKYKIITFILFSYTTLKVEKEINLEENDYRIFLTEKIFSDTQKYILLLNSEEEKREWSFLIKKYISESGNKRKSFILAYKNNGLDKNQLNTQENLFKNLSSKKGWMTKRGEIVKSWKKRYFVLENEKLCYYSNENETNALKSILIKDSNIYEPSPNLENLKSEFIQFNFSENRFIHLFDNTNKRDYYFITESEEEKDNWLLHFKFINHSIIKIKV